MYAVICGMVMALWSSPPERAMDVAREVLADRGFQKEMPGTDEAAAGRTYRTGKRGERARADRARAGAVGTLARYFLLVLMAATGVVLVVWLLGAYLGHARDAAVAGARAGPDAGEQGAGHAAVVERPLGDAETLARAGRYGEAIHTLLLRTLEALIERAGVRVPPAFTSREILARVALPDAAREALAELVVAVERSHFGGREPGAAEYERCRACFHAFARVYRGGRP